MIPKNFFSLDSGLFLFFLFLAIINGVSWGFADTYDHMSNVDVQTYVGLFNFEFDQHPVRRYRVIVPFLASAVHAIFGPVFKMLTPNEFPGDFATIMSFLFVNNLLMSLYGVLVFRICQAVSGSKVIWPAVLGVVSILTCRWTAYLAGSALVDSLFLVVLGLTLLGVLRNKLWMVILAIYLGPWAKEAFIFFVPLLIFVDRKHYPKLLIHLLLSGIIIFGFRYWFDQQIGASFSDSIGRDVSHFDGIPASLARLFSFHGLYEMFSIGGVWNLFIILGITQQKVRSYLKNKLGWIWVVLAVSVLFQALLSYELARMFYLLTPLLAVTVCLIFEKVLVKD